MSTAGRGSRYRCVNVVYSLEEATACMRRGRIKSRQDGIIADKGTHADLSVPTSHPI